MKKTVKAIGIMVSVLIFAVGFGGCNSDGDYGQRGNEVSATMETDADYSLLKNENNETADSPDAEERPCLSENEKLYDDNGYEDGMHEPHYQNESKNNESCENRIEIDIDIDALDWIDLGIISIPSILSYEEVGLHGSISITGDIFNSCTGVWGNIWMFAGPLKGDFEALIDNSESFTFCDGHVGLFMESFDLDIMGWIREDGNIVTFRHGGDMSIFTDNEELILQIVLSLR